MITFRLISILKTVMNVPAKIRHLLGFRLRICFVCLALAFGNPSVSLGQSEPTTTDRLYRYVQRWDASAGEWETLNASARVTQEGGKTTLTIWNNWCEEKINPLLRVVVESRPEQIEGEDESLRWRYMGRVSRGIGSTERSGTIESSTIIATVSNPIDMTIRTSDYAHRYRLGRKTPSHRKR